MNILKIKRILLLKKSKVIVIEEVLKCFHSACLENTRVHVTFPLLRVEAFKQQYKKIYLNQK